MNTSKHQSGTAAASPTQIASDHYDIIIVGGGAAGISAALVLGRARRSVAVIDAGHPRNSPAAHMHGFLGSDGLPPAELLDRGRTEITGYGVKQVAGIVASITPADATSGASHPLAARHRFLVALSDGNTLETRAVLVTTGLRDELPHLPGLRERWGRDVLHCPYCHGFEVRDQPLGILMGDSIALEESLAHAHLIRQWSNDVVLFSSGAALTVEQREGLVTRSIRIVEEPVLGLVVDDDQLTGVMVGSGQVVPRAALFVRPRFIPNDALLLDLGCAVGDHGWVQVDSIGATTVPGVWAAGNAVNPRAQVITAAGEGSAAAIAINNSLVEDDLTAAITNLRLGPLSTATRN